MTASNSSSPAIGQAPGLWVQCRAPVLLSIVGGAIDTIGFIALLGFFTEIPSAIVNVGDGGATD